MSESLFEPEDLYAGDPTRPDREHVTPIEVVARLTRPDREKRVRALIDQAHEIYDEAVSLRLKGRELAAECILFSGGNDSTTLAHLFRKRATHAIHANTTIGIEETRQYVRDTCASWGVPLIEETPPDSYRDLILGNVRTKAGVQVFKPGFPGPGAHGQMYTRLKERALDKARHTLGVANSRSKAVTFIAGIRRNESKRRADREIHQSDGTVIWVSPISFWTKLDLTTYRLMFDDVPRNRVSDVLHMSGECLCGAFAHPGELEEIRYWFPDVAAEIEALQVEAHAAGIAEPYCTWGHGKGRSADSGRLCQSCDVRAEDQVVIPGLVES